MVNKQIVKDLDILIIESYYMRLTCCLMESLGPGCLLYDFVICLNIRTCTYSRITLIMSGNLSLEMARILVRMNQTILMFDSDLIHLMTLLCYQSQFEAPM